MDEEVAIVGMSCRFPGASNPQKFWNNLTTNKSFIREIPPERWSIDEYYSKEHEKNKSTSKWAGIVDNFEHFDPMYFGISPREAQLMDPQQRVLLELSIQCIEDAGYSIHSLKGKNVGVYIGACNFDYKELLEKKLQSIEGHLSTGTYAALLANRISHFMDWKGPSIPVDTACSSSLVALNLAMAAIRSGECDSAIIGGVSYLSSHTYFVSFSQAGMLSPNGHCKTFDHTADGYVRGEGAGLVYLKRLIDAEKDGDHIYGIVNAVAVNHGGNVQTITSPSAYAQARVVSDAISKAQVSISDISYIEAHGTGTPKGDPIEINGLKRAFSSVSKLTNKEIKPNSCAIGAIKPQIGHLEAASGIAGLIKILLSIKNDYLPGLSNFETQNKRIKLKNTGFYLLENGCHWGTDKRKIAGISSFGFGGVNAHAIISEYTSIADTIEKKLELEIGTFRLTAHSNQALFEYALLLQYFLDQNEKILLKDISYTLGRRTQYTNCLTIKYQSRDELLEKLTSFMALGSSSKDVTVSEVLLEEDNSTNIQTSGNIVYLPPYPFTHKHYFPKELHAVSQKSSLDNRLYVLNKTFESITSTTLLCTPSTVETLFISVADSELSSTLKVIGTSHKYLELPFISKDSIDPHQWNIWVWEQIKTLRAQISLETPRNIVFISSTKHSFSSTFYSLLLSFEKEYKTPCLWCEVSSFDKNLGAKLLNLSIPKTGHCTLNNVSGDIRLEVEKIHCQPFISQKESSITLGSTVLITGGYGGLGKVFAEYLATHYQSNVVLCGRRSIQQSQLNNLKTGSGSISYYKADCTNITEMQSVISKVAKLFGQINTVIHAAGIIRDKSIFSKTQSDFEQVTRVKVLGCSVLDEVTKNYCLDNFIVCSSITGEFGNSGQTDYAAANGYLREFINHRDKQTINGLRSGRSVAIHWPYWHEGGMQISDQLQQMLFKSMGIYPLKSEDGLKILEFAFHSNNRQLCVVFGENSDIERKLNRCESKKKEEVTPHFSKNNAREILLHIISKITGIEVTNLECDKHFSDMGVDSIATQAIARELSRFTPVKITGITMAEHSSPEKLLSHIRESTEKSSSNTLEKINLDIPNSMNKDDGDFVVDIVGLDLQVSGCLEWQDVWRKLGQGLTNLTSYPKDRWKLLPKELRGERNREDVKGLFLFNALKFNNKNFNMSNRESMLTDPQHRLILESVRRAIADTGQSEAIFSEKRTAVFVCLDAQDYAEIVRFDKNIDEYSAHASTAYLAANRVSHYFDLEGFSELINSACSSVYVAIEKARNLIRSGIIEQAVISAAQLNILPNRFDYLDRKGLLAQDLDIAPFDERGHGFLRGEAVGTVVISKHSKHRDCNIYASIHGCASWHAGRGNGLTSPNPIGHAKAIQMAFANSVYSPEDLVYFEAHGTGSKIGDTSEIEALQSILSKYSIKSPVVLSTLKSDLGHLEVCSGIGAIIKAVLSIKNGVVPGISSLQSPLEAIDPNMIKVSQAPQHIALNEDQCVGLHAYGLGGVSAFIILSSKFESFKLQNQEIVQNKSTVELLSESKKVLLEQQKTYTRDRHKNKSAVVSNIADKGYIRDFWISV